MKRYRCSTCGGICDPGELQNGVCFDCRTARESRKERSFETGEGTGQRKQAGYREQADGQLVMELM